MSPEHREWAQIVRELYPAIRLKNEQFRNAVGAPPIKVSTRDYGGHEYLSDVEGFRFCRLHLRPDTATSVHIHHFKSHVFLVESGRLTAWDEQSGAREFARGDTYYVPPKIAHELSNRHDESLSLLEVMYPPTFEDKQILLTPVVEKQLLDQINAHMRIRQQQLDAYKRFLRCSSNSLRRQPVLELDKPYGTNTIVYMDDLYGVSFARLLPGNCTSLHFHQVRAELFIVRTGILTLNNGTNSTCLGPLQWEVSTPNVAHQLRNAGSEVLEILEIFSPPLLDDKVRVRDNYSRQLGIVYHNQ